MLKNATWLFLISFVILIVFLPAFTKMQDLRQRNLELRQDIEDLKKKNKKLGEERQLLENDPVYLEKVGRDKMGLIKEGEKVYRLVPMNATSKW